MADELSTDSGSDLNIYPVTLHIPTNHDFSEENPGLHLLYVKWACKHLAMIDKMIAKLHNQSNTNLHDFITALQEVRAAKVHTCRAYRDADEILVMIRTGKDPVADEPEEAQ